MRLPLAKYGLREIFLGSVVCGLAAAVAVWRFWPLAALPVGLWLWVLWFFRDPQRQAPGGAGVLLSPADGRVTDITPVGPDSELGREGLRIGIFMSIFDVHVNRSPAAGRVEGISRRGGGFRDARDPQAWEHNESTAIRMGYSRGGQVHSLVVRQVAGVIARRIVTDLVLGQELQPGQRIGMIKFGSRVELMAPRELVGEVRVRVGQTVRAGRTVLFAETPETGNA